MASSYSPPVALTVLAGIFLALGAVFFIINVFDIVWRRGWKSMMYIMIPVYPINASYMGPLTLYVYFKYGRPTKPGHDGGAGCHHEMNKSSDEDKEQQPSTDNLTEAPHRDAEQGTHGMHHDMSPSRPMWATVMIGVCHCGAGCVLGDLVGEWLVYGCGAQINGSSIWPELLIDYGFALLFGIFFQYFSIAPMSGEWGPKTLVRAAKADILSLTSFELGLFGWMVAYQVGIWEGRLAMDTWTYWWMMQVGMFIGFWTAFPVNWFLISMKIKEPCA